MERDQAHVNYIRYGDKSPETEKKCTSEGKKGQAGAEKSVGSQTECSSEGKNMKAGAENSVGSQTACCSEGKNIKAGAENSVGSSPFSLRSRRLQNIKDSNSGAMHSAPTRYRRLHRAPTRYRRLGDNAAEKTLNIPPMPRGPTNNSLTRLLEIVSSHSAATTKQDHTRGGISVPQCTNSLQASRIQCCSDNFKYSTEGQGKQGRISDIKACNVNKHVPGTLGGLHVNCGLGFSRVHPLRGGGQ